MKKINFSTSKIAKALTGKGFYVALCLSVVAVGTAAYVAYSATVTKLTKEPSISLPEANNPAVTDWDFGQVNKPQEDVPMDAVPDNAEVAAQPFVMPLNGEIINPYSYGELVKCSTTGIWKTHDGVDIKGDLGAEVKSMTGGTVTQIYEDPLWGVCIVIDHGNGYEGHYYNLNKVLPVKVGDTVSAGTVIGAIGDTAEVELAEPSHLHFGLKLSGKWVDPIMTISPGK